MGGKGSAGMQTRWHVSSMEPFGSAGEEATMWSQQGKMLHELLETWPADAWREVAKTTAGIE